MPPLLSSKALHKQIVGRSLARVKRHLFIPEYEVSDPSTRDESSDGPTEFITTDGLVFHVLGNTEAMSVEVFPGPCPSFGETFVERDVTSNAFWSQRMHKRVFALYALQSLYGPKDSASAFALEIVFWEGQSVVIEYISDDEHIDQIRLTGCYDGPPSNRISLAQS